MLNETFPMIFKHRDLWSIIWNKSGKYINNFLAESPSKTVAKIEIHCVLEQVLQVLISWNSFEMHDFNDNQKITELHCCIDMPSTFAIKLIMERSIANDV